MTIRSCADRFPRSQPIKLLVVAHDAGIGGAQLSLLEIVERLDRGRFEPVVCAPSPGPFVDELRSRGVKCYWGLTQRWVFFGKPLSWRLLVNRPWLVLRHPYLWTVLSWLTIPLRIVLMALVTKVEGVRLVYSNTVTVFDGALLAHLIGIPHVWHLRETVSGNSDLCFPGPVSWLPKFILATTSLAIVNSERLRRDLFGQPNSTKVRIVRNGVDMVDHSRDAPVEVAIPASQEARLTAICGTLTENKGIGVYLKAMQRLQELYPDLHHLIIGAGSENVTAALITQTRDLGLQDCVHFLGHRSDVRDLLASVDVVVSASIRESFGRVVIEAMACGVPVVATRSGGPEETIVDGESGFLVDVGDEVAMADRVASLLDNEPLRASIASAGQLRVRQCFNLEDTVSSVVGSFKEVLEQGSI